MPVYSDENLVSQNKILLDYAGKGKNLVKEKIRIRCNSLQLGVRRSSLGVWRSLLVSTPACCLPENRSAVQISAGHLGRVRINGEVLHMIAHFLGGVTPVYKKSLKITVTTEKNPHPAWEFRIRFRRPCLQ
jgi:hypothetical protein